MTPTDTAQIQICYSDDDNTPIGRMVWSCRADAVETRGNQLYDFDRDEGAGKIVQALRAIVKDLKALQDR